MNVIFLSKREGTARQFNLAHPFTLSLIAGFVLVVLGSAFVLGIQLGRGNHERVVLSDTVRFGATLAQQKELPISKLVAAAGGRWPCASAK